MVRIVGVLADCRFIVRGAEEGAFAIVANVGDDCLSVSSSRQALPSASVSSYRVRCPFVLLPQLSGVDARLVSESKLADLFSHTDRCAGPILHIRWTDTW